MKKCSRIVKRRRVSEGEINLPLKFNAKKIFFCAHKGGANPQGSLIHSLSGDTLFGMKLYGRTDGEGNIFSVSTNGNNYNELLDFTRINNRAYTQGSLILSGSTLFGMSTIER
jgi:hypothetical protein